MWFLKLLLLLTISASALPKNSDHDIYKSSNMTLDYESDDGEEEEDSEELAA